jgi:acetyl esterase/lipase
MSIEADVVYNTENGRELKVDLYRPQGNEVPTRTAVLLVHGGGWVLGDRHMVEALGSEFAAQGFLAVAVEYRLVREAPWPAQLDDVIAAVRWTADNAENLGVDPDRIVLAGASAGGQLAVLAAAALRDKPRVAAVLPLFCASELTVNPEPQKGLFNASALLGADATDEAVQAISPLHQVSADFPPVFLLHGGEDWLIDPLASLRFYNKLVELGVPTELHIVAGALHEFISEPGMTGPMVAEIGLFLSRMIIEPERWAAQTSESNLFAQGPEAVQALMSQLLEQAEN